MKQFIYVFVLVASVLILAMSMVACGGGEEVQTADTPKDTAKEEVAAHSSNVAKGKTSKAQSDEIAGWKKDSYENYGFSLPEGWKQDGDTGVFFPGDQSLAMGRPLVSLHCGGIPVMPGSTVKDRLEFYYGAAPTTIGDVEKCGMNGMFVEVTSRNHKHLGLILIEEVGPMKIINFFDCQAPVEGFHEKQEIFKTILGSVTCALESGY